MRADVSVAGRALSERAKGGIGIVKLWCMPDEFDLLDARRGRKYCSLDNARTTIRRMMALQARCPFLPV